MYCQKLATKLSANRYTYFLSEFRYVVNNFVVSILLLYQGIILKLKCKVP